MPAKRTPMNLWIIQSNLSEAVEELQRLKRKAAKEALTEAELQVGLSHACHHLFVTWNARNRTTEQYASLTDKQFREWGRYPKAIKVL